MTSPNIAAPSFQNSYSPGVVGALPTLGSAYSAKETSAPVPLYISRYLLFDEPSAYSEINKSSGIKSSSTSVIVTDVAWVTVPPEFAAETTKL